MVRGVSRGATRQRRTCLLADAEHATHSTDPCGACSTPVLCTKTSEDTLTNNISRPIALSLRRICATPVNGSHLSYGQQACVLRAPGRVPAARNSSSSATQPPMQYAASSTIPFQRLAFKACFGDAGRDLLPASAANCAARNAVRLVQLFLKRGRSAATCQCRRRRTSILVENGGHSPSAPHSHVNHGLRWEPRPLNDIHEPCSRKTFSVASVCVTRGDAAPAAPTESPIWLPVGDVETRSGLNSPKCGRSVDSVQQLREF